LSLTLGFIHGFVTNYPHFLEGEFGFWSNRLLAAQIGVPGVGGLLIFTLLTVLIVFFNFDFKFSGKNRETTSSQFKGKESANPSRDDERYLHESEYRIDPVEFRLNKNKELSEDEVPATNQLKTTANAANDTEKIQQNLTVPPKVKSEEVKEGLDFSIERTVEKP